MTTRCLSTFVDALAGGRRPRSFQAAPEEVEMLRVAIALRAARPGDAIPDLAFVAELHQRLADDLCPVEQTNVRPLNIHRGRSLLAGVAVGLALVGGAVAVTETSNRATVQQSATGLPDTQSLRTASFQDPTGQVAGQIAIYLGHPSWVFMNVDVRQSNGAVKCELHLTNGKVVAAGAVQLRDGSGVLFRSIQMNTGGVRGATLYDSSGAEVASAIFI
jgi:hypothetical protein